MRACVRACMSVAQLVKKCTHSQKKKCTHFTRKKKHTPAPICTHVRACALIPAQHACISTKTYNDQHHTHIPYTHQRYARTGTKTKHQYQYKKYSNQHRIHKPEKKNAPTTKKCTLQHQHAHLVVVCVRACVRVCLWLNLLFTPAPVSGSACGGGGVCL